MNRSELRLERLLAEWLALARPSPFPVFDPATRQRLPRGDGHAVLVLPASLRSDLQTVRLRAFLEELGYAPCGWSLGVNLGPTAPVIRGIGARLAHLASLHGAVSLVGFSMGGLFARLLACRYPEQVRQVITVCSPIVEPARSVWIPLEPLLRFWPGVDLRALAAEISAPAAVPATCIYSRDDGIVRWEHCRDPWIPERDNIEVRGCHVTMPHNREVLDVLVARLARLLPSQRRDDRSV